MSTIVDKIWPARWWPRRQLEAMREKLTQADLRARALRQQVTHLQEERDADRFDDPDPVKVVALQEARQVVPARAAVREERPG